MAKVSESKEDKKLRKAAKYDKNKDKSAGVQKKSKSDKKARKSSGVEEGDVSVVSAVGDAPASDDNDAMEVDTTEVSGAAQPDEVAVAVKTGDVVGALVPFANPLADEKTTKKVLKGVKKGMCKTLTTGANNHLHTLFSCKTQDPQARRQRSRQVPAQIHRDHRRRRLNSLRHRGPRRRHLAYGRHLAHPCTLRGSQRAVRLRRESRGARRGRQHEATDQCGYGDAAAARGEEEGCRRRRGRGGLERALRRSRQGKLRCVCVLETVHADFSVRADGSQGWKRCKNLGSFVSRYCSCACKKSSTVSFEAQQRRFVAFWWISACHFGKKEPKLC